MDTPIKLMLPADVARLVIDVCSHALQEGERRAADAPGGAYDAAANGQVGQLRWAIRYMRHRFDEQRGE